MAAFKAPARKPGVFWFPQELDSPKLVGFGKGCTNGPILVSIIIDVYLRIKLFPALIPDGSWDRRGEREPGREPGGTLDSRDLPSSGRSCWTVW